MMNQSKKKIDIRDRFAHKLLFTEKTELNEQEVQCFKQHPEEIGEITAPVDAHKFFLWFGSLLGIGLVILSNLIEVQTLILRRSIHLREALVSIVFEIGVVLIGRNVTAYLLGILLNNQQNKRCKGDSRYGTKSTRLKINEKQVSQPQLSEVVNLLSGYLSGS